MNDLTVFALLGCFAALFLIGIGFLMRKYDFSSMLRNPFAKDDGFYIRWGFKLKRIGDNNPENRKKFSKYLGNYFIGFSGFMLIVFIIILLLNRE